MATGIRRGDREARAASNQTLFRTIDEQLRGLGGTHETVRTAREAVCECANDACFEGIGLTPGEYETLRETGMRFAVAPQESHVFRDVERVAEQHKFYWVVEETSYAARAPQQLGASSRSA